MVMVNDEEEKEEKAIRSCTHDLSRFGDLFLCDFLGVFERARAFLLGVGDSDWLR